MHNYTKPSANVIEIAVKESLSRTTARNRQYRIQIGQYTFADNGNKDIMTNIYAATGISKVRWSDDES